jgi:hypothetical protein
MSPRKEPWTFASKMTEKGNEDAGKAEHLSHIPGPATEFPRHDDFTTWIKQLYYDLNHVGAKFSPPSGEGPPLESQALADEFGDFSGHSSGFVTIATSMLAQRLRFTPSRLMSLRGTERPELLIIVPIREQFLFV